ncbi:MAG: PspC domain-containing protein [Lentimicrobiaceae bacterium]|nr:PspC domain-containing protein [Lentimicrobiaceae bacterium]
MSQKKLTRSISSRMIAGVCGGLGEYFNLDPVVFRVIFCVFGLTGSGIIAYLILILVIPAEDNVSSAKCSGISEEWIDSVTQEIKKEITEEVKEEIVTNVKKHSSSFALIAGATLIIIGLLFLFHGFHFRYLIPVAFMGLGIILLASTINHHKKS